jgi:hypothetical protein
MWEYFSIKKLENYRYEISTLRNKEVTKGEENKIKKAEYALKSNKVAGKLYLYCEFARLCMRGINKFSNKPISTLPQAGVSLLLIYLRVNVFYIMANFATCYYIENVLNLNKEVKKHTQEKKSDFKQFIQNK